MTPLPRRNVRARRDSTERDETDQRQAEKPALVFAEIQESLQGAHHISRIRLVGAAMPVEAMAAPLRCHHAPDSAVVQSAVPADGRFFDARDRSPHALGR